MKINRDQLIPALAAIGFAAAFVALFWLPHHAAVAEKREKIVLQKQQLDTTLAKAKTDQIKSQRTDTTQADFDLAIPPKADLGPLLVQVSGRLDEASVQDRELKTNTVVEGSDFSRVPMTLHFKGNLLTLFDLLGWIESHKRIIRVDKLTVQNGSADQDDLLLINVEMSTFFRDGQGGAS